MYRLYLFIFAMLLACSSMNSEKRYIFRGIQLKLSQKVNPGVISYDYFFVVKKKKKYFSIAEIIVNKGVVNLNDDIPGYLDERCLLDTNISFSINSSIEELHFNYGGAFNYVSPESDKIKLQQFFPENSNFYFETVQDSIYIFIELPIGDDSLHIK